VVSSDRRVYAQNPKLATSTTSQRKLRWTMIDIDKLMHICNGLKTSELRHSMPCIEMPEVAYLYGYLLVSARENTPE
jgi:hypothetical protein